MFRFSANSWIDLNTARAREVECECDAKLPAQAFELDLIDCQTGDRTCLKEIFSREVPTVVVLLRHFA